MSYAIVGFGKIGQALAHAFARKNIDVTVASRRPPEALAPQARAIGPTVVAKSLAGCTRGRHNHLGGPVRGASRGCEGPAELERQDDHRHDERVWQFHPRSWTASRPPPSSRKRSPVQSS